MHVQVDGGISHDNIRTVYDAGADLIVCGAAIFGQGGPPAHVPPARPGVGVTHLERAIELAERGRGTTRPNPVVGAVVVSEGEVVGEGWHERKGGPHAEVVALEAAGDRARGATLFVTMEPCSHHGSTPPCTEAVLEAGVAKVVAGSLDPNPEAAGGLDALAAAASRSSTRTRSRPGRRTTRGVSGSRSAARSSR